MIVDANAAFTRLVGLPSGRIGKTALGELVAPEDREGLNGKLAAGETNVHEVSLTHADGTLIPVELRSRTIIFRGVETRVSAFVDLRERKAAEERLRFTALHDPLTQLPNRLLFQRRLEETLSGLQAGNRMAALLSIDLDRFKDINDLYGHPAGDIVIRTAADRLRAILGDAGHVARLGGDEFAVILTDITFANQVADLAFRIVGVLGEPVDIGNGVRLRPGPASAMRWRRVTGSNRSS